MTFGDSGGLCFMAFGIHRMRAETSIFAIPFEEISRKASRKPFRSHPSSSAMAISPARDTPGIKSVCGPVSRCIQRVFALGVGDESERYFSSACIDKDNFRYLIFWI